MAKAPFKFCTMCTPRYRKPVAMNRRKCPTCGAKGKFAFRMPTAEEVKAHQEEKAKRASFIDDLANDEGCRWSA